MKFKPKFDGNMKNMNVNALINYVNGIPGAYVECDADNLSAIRRVPERIECTRRALSVYSQLAALRAPANRSQLGQLHFQIMLSIGRKAFDDATLCPVDPVEYATPEGYTNAAWAYAMYKMRHFYKTTVARKEVNFNATR